MSRFHPDPSARKKRARRFKIRGFVRTSHDVNMESRIAILLHLLERRFWTISSSSPEVNSCKMAESIH